MRQISLDVCVIGGGPAGLSAANRFASANLNVGLIIERPGYRINTGETLHPSALSNISKLQIVNDFEMLDFKQITGFESTWGAPQVSFQPSVIIPDGGGWLFERTVFEDMLLTQFKKRGGYIFSGRFDFSYDSVWHLKSTCRETMETIRASLLVIATGRKAFNSFRLHPKQIFDKLISYTMEVPCDDNDMLVRIDALEKGWLYSINRNGGYRVFSYFTDGDIFKEKHPQKIARHISDLIPDAPALNDVAKTCVYEDVRNVTVTSANTTFMEKAFGRGWIGCGDCVQTYDPLSSQGISWAMKSGIDAANAVMDFLSGFTGAFQFAEMARKAKFHEYLKDRKFYYSRERRWETSTFWSRRH
jgi:flavin-dependent dehydrogenase